MTLEQAKEINGLTQEQKQLLLNIETTAKRFQRVPKDFAATTPTELKKELDEVIARNKKRKAAVNVKKHIKEIFLQVITEMTEGKNAIITLEELTERLRKMRGEIEKEKKQIKLEQLIEQSGLNKDELIEYFSKL